jgi:hypothetical protein
MRKKKILTNLEIFHIVKKYRIEIDSFSIDADNRLNVQGNVRISDTGLCKLPLKFGKVTGNFHCYLNKLTSLKGAPYMVGGNFNCSDNRLQNLEYAPKEVGGDFFCQSNQLNSLFGSPRIIPGNFNCFLNKLTTLKNGPEQVFGSYFCYHNELATLDGAAHYVGKSFHVTGNLLKNLIGCPSYIGDIFSFDNCMPSINLGICNPVVNRIEIQVQKGSAGDTDILPQIIIDNQKFLPIVFKYYSYIREGDILDIENFSNIIQDIKEGFR